MSELELLRPQIEALSSLLSLGKWDAALSLADELVRSHSRLGDVLGLAGLAHAAAGNHERARSLLSEAPRTQRHLNALASVCLKQGDLQAAAAAAESCVAIDGGDKTARQLLEIARSRMRDQPATSTASAPVDDLPAFAALRRGDLAGGLSQVAAMLSNSGHPGGLARKFHQ